MANSSGKEVAIWAPRCANSAEEHGHTVVCMSPAHAVHTVGMCRCAGEKIPKVSLQKVFKIFQARNL